MIKLIYLVKLAWSLTSKLLDLWCSFLNSKMNILLLTSKMLL
jgi:hypothetical protein